VALPDTTTDLGTDVHITQDAAPVWGLARGDVNLANAIARRLGTPRGGLFYDPDYGYDLRAHLNQALTDAEMSAVQGAIVGEVEKDPRVHSGAASLRRGSLEVGLSLETADGTVDLVLRATDVTVEVLSVGGVATAEAVLAAAPTEITRIGDAGPAGIQGPAGPSGGGTAPSVDLDFGDGTWAVDSGDEEVVFSERLVDFDDLPASLTVKFSAEVSSADGTSTFRARVGGAAGAADGTIVATITTASATPVRLQASGSVASLTGELLVKITAENATVGEDARIRAPLVTIR
jgi:hypothetical protein